MPASSELIRYEVRMQSQPAWNMELLGSMNTPGGFALRLPVEPRPASLLDEWDSIRFRGEIGEDRFAELVGEPVGADPFYPPSMSPFQHERWTSGKFAGFVLSRRHLRLPWMIDGQPAATLVALAAYLMSPILVRYHLNGTQRLVFITAFGEVTHAEYSGDEEALSLLKGSFIGGTLALGLRQPGVKVLPEPVDPHPFEAVVNLRRDQLDDWRRERLPADRKGTPPAGMSPDDLTATPAAATDFRRAVIASAHYQGRLYEMIVPPVGDLAPLDVQCAVDGVLQNYTDPVTGADKGPGAWVSDWADWILEDSARGAASAGGSRPWETGGVEADLYRLEHNIVSYSEEETDVSRFHSADELQSWLDRSLGNHNTRLRVLLLDDLSLVLSGALPAYQRVDFNRAESEEPVVRVAERKFSPWDVASNWAGAGGSYSRHPVLSMTVDGEQLESYSAVNCLDDGWLNNDMLPPGTPATASGWYVLRIEDTRTAIAFPARGTMLTVATDHDGASAMVVAREASERRQEIERDNAFDMQWARWLHDDRPLTRDEIREGLETVRKLIREAGA